MPEVVMPHAASSTSKVETTNQIQEPRRLTNLKETIEHGGSSDSETESDNGEDDDHKHHGSTSGLMSIKSRHLITQLPKNGMKDWRFASSNLMKRRNDYIEEKKKLAKDEHLKVATHNDREINIELDGEKHRYMFDDVAPMMAGQSEEELQTPIMTPPPPYQNIQTHTSNYKRHISLSFLCAGETLTCDFHNEKYLKASKSLLSISESRNVQQCHCSVGCVGDDSLTGWERTEKSEKTKPAKRRKRSSQVDGSAFLRLAGVLNSDKDDPVAFQYYEDSKKYIERYRFFHAVGNICRPKSEIVQVEVPMKKDMDNEPYFAKLKPASCATATEVDIYSLITTAKSKKPKPEVKRPASSKSSESANEKVKSEDDDSYEEDATDTKPFSMKDRGKTLNLAPVRECMVPDLIPTDNFDQYQQNYIELNQYLNLITPPSARKNLQFQMDDLKERRFGSRILNISDNNLFPAYSPRRGVKPLRLGSAEFVKPGSDAAEGRWSNETKPAHSQSMQRASTFYSTVPGNLIMGSTVTPSNHSSATSRSRNGKSSPFASFPKEQTAYAINTKRPQTPPQHVHGKKYKPCERVTDLTMPKDRPSRFPYTHTNNGSSDKMSSQCRTVVAMDIKDSAGVKREKLKQLTLDVNHLGIRGKTFQHGQITVLYTGKDRRTTTLKS